MLWMATTPDKYELPLAVARSADELAGMLKVTKSTVVTMAWKREKGRMKDNGVGRDQKYRIYKVSE